MKKEEIVTVKFTHRRDYGRDRYYPSNEIAHLVCNIASRRSLTEQQIENIKRNYEGIEVEIKEDRA